MKVLPGIRFFHRHCSQEKLLSFRRADPSKIDDKHRKTVIYCDKHRKTMMHTWNTRALLRWQPEGGHCAMWKTSNNLLHFGRAWGKILHNKSFCSVFQEKTPPISIQNLTSKMGRENWRHGRRKPTFSIGRTTYQVFALPRDHPFCLRLSVSSLS